MVRDRKIRTALRTNQITGFVTVPSWEKKNNEMLILKKKQYLFRTKHMLFPGWEVRIVKNCDRGLENAARGRRPRAAFSRPTSQFFTIRTDPKPVNNMFNFVFFPAVNWFYRLQMGLFTQVLSLNRLGRRLLTICRKSWQRGSNSDSRQRKMYWRTDFSRITLC